MNSKIIVGVIIIALIAVAAYMFTTSKPEATSSTSQASTQTTVQTDVAAAELSSVISEEYAILIEEELNKLSIEQTDFNSQMQDNMANDLSQFYYT